MTELTNAMCRTRHGTGIVWRKDDWIVRDPPLSHLRGPIGKEGRWREDICPACLARTEQAYRTRRAAAGASEAA